MADSNYTHDVAGALHPSSNGTGSSANFFLDGNAHTPGASHDPETLSPSSFGAQGNAITDYTAPGSNGGQSQADSVSITHTVDNAAGSDSYDTEITNAGVSPSSDGLSILGAQSGIPDGHNGVLSHNHFGSHIAQAVQNFKAGS